MPVVGWTVPESTQHEGTIILHLAGLLDLPLGIVLSPPSPIG